MTPLRIESADAMIALGARLAKLLPERCVVYVEGALGAGKTTLVRGVLRGLDYTGRVPSPSFSLVEPYDLNGRSVVHVDLYRLTEPVELEYLGLADLLGPRTVLLVEWPERGAGRLPKADLHVSIVQVGAHAGADAGSLAGEARDVVLEPETPAGQAVASALSRC